jgi:hypothetical protein
MQRDTQQEPPVLFGLVNLNRILTLLVAPIAAHRVDPFLELETHVRAASLVHRRYRLPHSLTAFREVESIVVRVGTSLHWAAQPDRRLRSDDRRKRSVYS